MEEALIARLLADGALAALVADRIWWNERPQGSALPAIVLQLVDDAPVNAEEGATGLSEARVQVDCWASARPGANGGSVARQVGRAVVAALAVEFVSHGMAFDGVFVEGARDTGPEMAAGNVPVYRRSLDLDVWYG